LILDVSIVKTVSNVIISPPDMVFIILLQLANLSAQSMLAFSSVLPQRVYVSNTWTLTSTFSV